MPAKLVFYSWVFSGGVIGSILREVLAPLFPTPVQWLPILVINTIAAIVIGFVYGIEQRLHHHLKTFYAVGFCGGFSTFSHFSYQTVRLVESGRAMSAMANTVLSVAITLIAVWTGLGLAKRMYNNAPGSY